jgi:predicted metal-dependent HD superfamily phosphohydrolase
MELISILASQWQVLLQPFRVDPKVSEQVFLDLVAAYSSPGRYYHTLAHVRQILLVLEEMQLLAQNLAVLEFAAWFHDAIYSPQAKDNEFQSAELAATTLPLLNVPPSTIDLVKTLILKTQRHPEQESDLDAQIFLDADLSILAAPAPEYQQYAQNISQEYAWLEPEKYRLGRQQVLDSFLQRKKIFLTTKMQETLETRARENLQIEITSLEFRT